MKRIMYLLTALFLLLLTSSCSSRDKILWPNESHNMISNTEINSTASLTIIFPILRNMPKDMDKVQNELSKITEKKLHVAVKLIGISNVNYEQKCRLMLASQEKVDLISTGTLGNMDYSREVANGQLLSMNELVNKYGKDIKSSLGEFLNSGKINGKIYGLPTLRDEAKAAGFAIRKDLVDKYKIDLSKVENLKDIEPILKIIKEKEPGMAPLFPSQESISGIDYSMKIPGGDPLSNDYFFSGVLLNARDRKLKVVDYFETSEYASIIKLIRKWYKAGYLLPGIITNDDSAYMLTRAGKIASFLQDVKPGIEGQISKQCARDMIVVTLTKAISNTSTVTGFMWGIPSYAKTPKKSMEFLNLMYSDSDIVNLLDWGIEGIHYVKQAHGCITYPDGVNASNTGYGMNEGFVFGNQMLSYVWKGDPKNLWEQMKLFNKTAIKSKAIGFLFDTTPVENEFTACVGIWNEYQKALGVGAVDPDKVLPEFISKLKAAGVDKIVLEKQRQLNLWAKENHIK